MLSRTASFLLHRIAAESTDVVNVIYEMILGQMLHMQSVFSVLWCAFVTHNYRNSVSNVANLDPPWQPIHIIPPSVPSLAGELHSYDEELEERGLLQQVAGNIEEHVFLQVIIGGYRWLD